jgi:hypothetical protein
MERLFTREEAEALLPLLSQILGELRDLTQQLQDLRRRLASISETARLNGHAVEATRLEREAARLVDEMNDRMAQIHALGVEVKDIATGLVDFRMAREGRVVYLCWRLGEPRIQYWHELDAGFAGRQPLDM